MDFNSGVTIYQVAKSAGVSISTVSRWLNSPGKVNSVTAERIRHAIDTLGYIPQGNTGPKLNRSVGRIGVLIPFFSSPSFIERLQGLIPVFRRENFELVLFTVESPEQFYEYLHSIVFAKRLDGLIIMSMAIPEEDAERLMAAGLKIVTIEFSSQRFSVVEADNVRGGELAAELFITKNYLPAAYLGERHTPPYSIEPSRLRLGGFSGSLASHGVFIRPEHIKLSDLSVEDARNVARELLACPGRPRGIFAMSDIHAIGVLKAARDLSLRIPEDLAILGFDDIKAADYFDLSTISQSLQESGRLAAENLIASIREPERPRQSIRIDIEVVQRGTT
jgi:LacI family transcriptional regulator